MGVNCLGLGETMLRRECWVGLGGVDGCLGGIGEVKHIVDVPA